MPEEGLHLHGRVRTQAHECGVKRRFGQDPKRRFTPHSKALRALDEPEPTHRSGKVRTKRLPSRHFRRRVARRRV